MSEQASTVVRQASPRRAAAQPSTPDARQIKAVVRELRADGASAGEIKAELVSRFGPDVLSLPPRKKRAIALALGLLLVTIGAVLVWSRRRRRRDQVHARDEALLDEEPQGRSGLPIDRATVPIGDDEA
jgi:cytochrome c-type biogenesis protein CcmH/NrfF